MNRLYGLIDRTGAWVVKPKYDSIDSGGLLPQSWWTIKTGQGYGLLDDNLRELIAPQLDQSPIMCVDGQFIGIVDKKWKLFSRDGSRQEYSEAGCDSMISSRRN